MLRTQDLKKHTFDSIDPWGPILNEVAYAIHNTHHTINRASPGQLVFTPYQPDWNDMTLNIQKVINKNNVAENAKCLEYNYAIDDEVLISRPGHFVI